MAEPETPSPRTWRGWTRGERLVVAGGALLVADLLLLPWHRYALNVDVSNLGIELPKLSYERTGVQSPQAGFGVLALVLAALMVIQVVAAKIRPGLPRMGQIHLVAGPAALGLLLAKLLSNDEFIGTGAWLSLLFGAGLALGGYMLSQEGSAPDPVARRAPGGSVSSG